MEIDEITEYFKKNPTDIRITEQTWNNNIEKAKIISLIIAKNDNLPISITKHETIKKLYNNHENNKLRRAKTKRQINNYITNHEKEINNIIKKAQENNTLNQTTGY